tara:strand:- start:248 stop:622 length:375 start_codon:yes stop_codon:yes gene_type:complete
MKNKNKPLETVIDQHNHSDFPETFLMNILDEFGYKTDLFCGISRTRVSSDCPQRAVDMIRRTISELWWKMDETDMREYKMEQEEKFWDRRKSPDGDIMPSEDTQEYKNYWNEVERINSFRQTNK